jgi:hypothetical protein
MLPHDTALCSTLLPYAASDHEMAKKPAKPPRLSVTLTPAEHIELLALKDAHRVSLAWLGRQAIVEFIEKYRDEHAQLPLRLSR